jgi:PST family polysaccharide transporter
MTDTAREVRPGAAMQPGWIGNETVAGGLRRSAVRSWAVTAAGQGGKLLVTLVTTAVMARLLTPGDYGLVAMVTVFVGFIATFKDLGLSQATVQRPNITEQQVSAMFWLNVAAGLLIMIAMAASAPLVSRFYNRPELLGICLAYAALTPISSLGAQHYALLRRTMRYRSLALRDLAAVVLGACVGVACALQGWGYWSIVTMHATVESAGTGLLWWQSGWRPGLFRWTDDLRPMMRFGGALTVSNLLRFVASGLDSVVVGFFFGASALGFYNRAQQILSQPLKQVLPPVMNVAGSAFARVAGDSRAFEAAAIQLAFMIGCVSSLIVAIAVVGADWIVLIMLGPQWELAASLARVLAIFAFVEPVAALLATLMTARGMPGRLVRWRLVSSVVIVASLAAGLPWGFLGVAAAYSLSGCLVRTPLFIWYAAHHFEIAPRRLFSSIGVPLAAGAMTSALVALFRFGSWPSTHPAVSLLLSAALATAIHLGLLWSFEYSRTKLRAAVALVRHGLDARPALA